MYLTIAWSMGAQSRGMGHTRSAWLREILWMTDFFSAIFGVLTHFRESCIARNLGHERNVQADPGTHELRYMFH